MGKYKDSQNEKRNQTLIGPFLGFNPTATKSPGV
jgi:hypothetical protein